MSFSITCINIRILWNLLCSIIFHGTMLDTSTLQCMQCTYFVAPVRFFSYDLCAVPRGVTVRCFYVCGFASFLINVCRALKFWNPGFSIFVAFLYVTNYFVSSFKYLLSFFLCISSSFSSFQNVLFDICGVVFVIGLILISDALSFKLQLFKYFDDISLFFDLLVAPKLKKFNPHSLIYVDDWLIGRKTTADCKRSTSNKFQFFTLFRFIHSYYCLRKRGSPCARREGLGEMKVQLHLFLTAALRASEW